MWFVSYAHRLYIDKTDSARIYFIWSILLAFCYIFVLIHRECIKKEDFDMENVIFKNGGFLDLLSFLTSFLNLKEEL